MQGSSCAKLDFMKSVLDSLDADIGSNGIPEVRRKSLNRDEHIWTGLKSKTSVLSRSLPSMICMSSHGCTKRTIPGPSSDIDRKLYSLTNKGRLLHQSACIFPPAFQHNEIVHHALDQQMVSLTLLQRC
jgi:hypothetical protein